MPWRTISAGLYSPDLSILGALELMGYVHRIKRDLSGRLTVYLVRWINNCKQLFHDRVKSRRRAQFQFWDSQVSSRGVITLEHPWRIVQHTQNLHLIEEKKNFSTCNLPSFNTVLTLFDYSEISSCSLKCYRCIAQLSVKPLYFVQCRGTAVSTEDGGRVLLRLFSVLSIEALWRKLTQLIYKRD